MILLHVAQPPKASTTAWSTSRKRARVGAAAASEMNERQKQAAVHAFDKRALGWSALHTPYASVIVVSAHVKVIVRHP